MKINPRFLLAAVTLFLTLPVAEVRAAAVNSAAELATETFERLGKLWGRVPVKGAAEALEAAIKLEGAAAVRAAEHGGPGLAAAAARHGGEVFSCAVRVPEAGVALATSAETLLPLARRFGDDVLRIEARAPGLGAEAAQMFGANPGHLADLAKLEGNTLQKTLGFARHCPDAAAREAILKMAKRQGGGFLDRLSPRIAREGGFKMYHLALAALAGAILSHAPGNVVDVVTGIGGGVFGWAVAVIGWAVGLVLATWLACQLRLFSRLRAEWQRWKKVGRETGNSAAPPL